MREIHFTIKASFCMVSLGTKKVKISKCAKYGPTTDLGNLKIVQTKVKIRSAVVEKLFSFRHIFDNGFSEVILETFVLG